jgi:predicted dehydrogenase
MNLDSLKEMVGLDGRKVRYAIVGVGSISQEALMPGVEHTGNSEMTALVTSDGEKARELGAKYGILTTCDYAEYPALLRSGKIDAVYIGTPNWRHAEFAIPALEAGIHVLLEKPMEVSSEQAERIVEAQKKSSAKLMVAYRLHFEPATIAAIEKVRSGELGEVHTFTCTFSLLLDPENHRAHSGELAGPVLDMGPYPINGSRNIFGAEPTEVFAWATRHPNAGFPADLDDTVSVTMRFPENRIAQFTITYYGNIYDSYTLVGSKGILEVNPAFMYGKPLEHYTRFDQKDGHESFKNTDHFGGELKYFSSCILHDKEPEPDGLEGLADVRVIEAIHRSIKSGQPEKVVPTTIYRRIDPDQVEKLGAVSTPEMVHASAPARGTEKNPKN